MTTTGLYIDPNFPGCILVMTSMGFRHLEQLSKYNWENGRLYGLAKRFGYAGPVEEQEVTEWLCDKATVLLPPEAELSIPDDGFFTRFST